MKVKDVSEEEKARKAAILAAYSTVGSGEEYPLIVALRKHAHVIKQIIPKFYN